MDSYRYRTMFLDPVSLAEEVDAINEKGDVEIVALVNLEHSQQLILLTRERQTMVNPEDARQRLLEHLARRISELERPAEEAQERRKNRRR